MSDIVFPILTKFGVSR